MDKRKLHNIQNALRRIAMRDGKTVAQVKAEIQTALTEGMNNPDSKVQEYWKRIPCVSEVPTVEEVIVFLADETRGRYEK